MAFIPALNVARTTLRMTKNAVPNKSYTFNFRVLNEAGFVSAMFIALAETITAWWSDYCIALTNSSTALNGIYMVGQTEPNDAYYDWTDDLPLVGTRSGAVPPAQVCLSVKHNTINSGKSGRGRTYWTGFVEADVDNRLITTTYGNNVVAAFNALDDALAVDGDWQRVLVSYYSGNAPRENGLILPITNSGLADYRVDTQRRYLD